jgi:hypothetical protein
MYLLVTEAFEVRLEEPADFKRFHIDAAHPASAADRVRRALDGIAALDGDGRAWVSAARLRSWPGVDQAFRDGLARMIEKAKPYGWIDEKADAIKAHIKWRE